MSSPRIVNSNGEIIHSVPKDSLASKYAKSVFIGGAVGSFSNFLTHFIDKVVINLQNGDSKGMVEGIKKALGNGNALKGLGMGQFAAITKNIVLFPLFQFSQGYIQNKFMANFIAAIVGTYLLSPLSVVKTLRYGNQPFSSVRHIRDLYRGVHATAIRDGLQYGIYFMVEPIIKNALKEQADFENAAVTGAIAGMAGSIISNPLAVIATRQKLSSIPESILNMGKKIYCQNGARGFYPLFFTTSMFRAGIVQGAAIGVAKKYAEEVYPRVEEFSEKMIKKPRCE